MPMAAFLLIFSRYTMAATRVEMPFIRVNDTAKEQDGGEPRLLLLAGNRLHPAE